MYKIKVESASGGAAAFSPETANLLVTGGAGFIGSNFIRYVFEKTGFRGRLINFDKLTYAGNPFNLDGIRNKQEGANYFFEKGDICDFDHVEKVFIKYNVNCVVHFAAESHVDRSIHGPRDFINTNLNGTFNLLEAGRRHWNDRKDARFHHISTDEVYGSLPETGYFYEETPYDPRSPYSASKAGSDHLVRAYFHTYGLPVTVSNCSNNYGPYQFPEKLIPFMVLNALEGKPLPVYGDGKNIRDWLYVDDHCDAIWLILINGRTGETYNIGGENERANIDIVNRICDLLEEILPARKNEKLSVSEYRELITFIKDRPGHDRRYAINCDKIKRELKWNRKFDFEAGLRKTIEWYCSNPEWTGRILNNEYRNWIAANYESRLNLS